MTTRLGLVTVAMSCLAMIVIMYHAWIMFGLPLEGGPIDGFRLKLIAWVLLIIIIVPAAFYAGMVLVYGIFGLIMLVLGKLTWQQVIDITCSAKYPKEWYRPNA